MIKIDDIQAAATRMEGTAIRTPLLQSAVLNERAAAQVWIKPECLQHIGAFKFRGAYNRLSQLDADARRSGVVAFSSGNHAQGVAYAAQLLGMPACIVMPSDAPKIKLAGTKQLGAEVRLYSRHTESREQIAAEIAERTGATLVPAFDDPDIIAGQGTVGLELMQQMGEKGFAREQLAHGDKGIAPEQMAHGDIVPNRVVSPCGGGGLLAGVATAVKALQPKTRVYGVEPDQFDDHLQSRRAGKRIKIDGTTQTLCDALMATTPGEITWSINSRLVDGFLAVSEDEVMHAVSFAFRYLKLVVEPGGAVGLAALLQNRLPDVPGPELKKPVTALILSGGNIDPAVLQTCLEQYPEP